MLSSRTRRAPFARAIRSSSSRRRPWPRPRAVGDHEHALDLRDARLEHAQPAAADRRGRPRRARATPRPGRRTPPRWRRSSRSARSPGRAGRARAPCSARTARARRPSRAPSWRISISPAGARRSARIARSSCSRGANSSAARCTSAHERLGRQRARVLGEQLVEARVAEQLAAAARLRRPSVNANSRSPTPERRLVLARSAPSSSTPSGRPVLPSSSSPPAAQQPRRRVAAVGPAERPPSRNARKTGTNVSRRMRGRTSALVCASTSAGRVAVPRARLDEEAHHRAQPGVLAALAADVADQHGERRPRQPPQAEEVAAAGLCPAGS